MAQQILTPELFYNLKLYRGWLLKTIETRTDLTQIAITASSEKDMTEITAFRLIFKNCSRYIVWELTPEEYKERSGYPVTGFDLDERPGKKAAIIYTSDFELVIRFGELIFQT